MPHLPISILCISLKPQLSSPFCLSRPHLSMYRYPWIAPRPLCSTCLPSSQNTHPIPISKHAAILLAHSNMKSFPSSSIGQVCFSTPPSLVAQHGDIQPPQKSLPIPELFQISLYYFLSISSVYTLCDNFCHLFCGIMSLQHRPHLPVLIHFPHLVPLFREPCLFGSRFFLLLTYAFPLLCIPIFTYPLPYCFYFLCFHLLFLPSPQFNLSFAHVAEHLNFFPIHSSVSSMIYFKA